MKLQLKQKVQKDSRSFLPTKSFIAKLKLKYNFKEDLSALRALYNVVDTNIYNSKWNSDKAKGMNAFMFGFANKTYTQADYVNYMLKSRPRDRKEIPVLLNAMYDKMVNAMLTDYEDSKLEEQYPEFRLLMKEYRDGILLFELTDKKVWSKAVKDSAGLAQYYEGHKNNYMWPKRWDVDVFMCANAVIAKSLRKDLKKKKGGLTVKELEEKYNKESQLNLRVVSGKFNAEENEIVKQHLPAAPGLSADISHDGQVIIIRCNAILEPTPKQLSDAKGIITTDYQKYLEDEWIKSLQAKYPVVINYDVLYSIK
jgi:peptidyl-prolyl cis-trans isomerase SurA